MAAGEKTPLTRDVELGGGGKAAVRTRLQTAMDAGRGVGEIAKDIDAMCHGLVGGARRDTLYELLPADVADEHVVVELVLPRRRILRGGRVAAEHEVARRVARVHVDEVDALRLDLRDEGGGEEEHRGWLERRCRRQT